MYPHLSVSLVQNHTHQVHLCFICTTSVLHQPFLTVPSILRVFPVGLLGPISAREAVSPVTNHSYSLALFQFTCQNHLSSGILYLSSDSLTSWLSGAVCRYWRKFPKLECSSWKDWCAYGEILEHLSGPGLPEVYCHLEGRRLRP